MNDSAADITSTEPSEAAPSSTPDPEAIRAWLTRYLGALLQMPEDEIATDEPLASYGLDSSAAVGMAGDLGQWLELTLDADLVYYHPTVDALSMFLASEAARR